MGLILINIQKALTNSKEGEDKIRPRVLRGFLFKVFNFLKKLT